MPAKFGTSGLRGLVKDITDGTCERHVRGYLRHLIAKGSAKKGDNVYIGQDFRPSSLKIATQTFNAVFLEGFVPIDCGALPTPALANYAMKNASASIMITGSHIPSDRNGIKFYRGDGEIDKTDEIAIANFANDVEIQTAANTFNISNEHKAAMKLFAERFSGLIPADAFLGKRIGIYEHSSVARDFLHDLLQSFGAETISLGRSEGFIPVDTEAVSEETQATIKKWTPEYNLDAIISTDGDADRPLLSDENGKVIKGDVLGFITCRFLEADRIATPISSNSGIKDTDHVKVTKTRVGSPYVIEAMNEAIAQGGTRVTGFEANGGFLVASDIAIGSKTLDALPTRDCILPLLAPLSLAFSRNKSLSELVIDHALPTTQAGRIQEFPTDVGQKLIAELKNNRVSSDRFFASFGKIANINTIDGLRVTLDNEEIIHLRPSGNAPEMRCYIEARDETHADELVRKVITHIRSHVAVK
ncbi:phosphomannomutase [Lentilitoribacter sp. EG35]|uniref:phosphomannomutase n=1 Tax=Lentilitoribacter sp. EG35 TaxID=3234192 RepID=UPI0034606923